MSDKVVVDALPYIDQGYDEPGVREAAIQMVQEETRHFRPTKNYLEHLPTPKPEAFHTDIMRREFERMQSRHPMEPLNMRRYELPMPPGGRMTDIQAWSECVDNSCAQLEHQTMRIVNLQLMVDYGSELWRAYVEQLTKVVNETENKLADLKKEIQEVNWARKTFQTQAGEQLKQLEATWVFLVSKNYEIEQACLQIEKELRKKSQKK